MSTKQAEETFRTSIGGQALIEGIMMRGPKKQAIAVRKPDGEIEVKTEDLKLAASRCPVDVYKRQVVNVSGLSRVTPMEPPDIGPPMLIFWFLPR